MHTFTPLMCKTYFYTYTIHNSYTLLHCRISSPPPPPPPPHAHYSLAAFHVALHSIPSPPPPHARYAEKSLFQRNRCFGEITVSERNACCWYTSLCPQPSFTLICNHQCYTSGKAKFPAASSKLSTVMSTLFALNVCGLSLLFHYCMTQNFQCNLNLGKQAQKTFRCYFILGGREVIRSTLRSFCTAAENKRVDLENFRCNYKLGVGRRHRIYRNLSYTENNVLNSS